MNPSLPQSPEFNINSSVLTQCYGFSDPFHASIFHCIFNQDVGQPELHYKLNRHFLPRLGTSTCKTSLLGKCSSARPSGAPASTSPPSHTLVLQPGLGGARVGGLPAALAQAGNSGRVRRTRPLPAPPPTPTRVPSTVTCQTAQSLQREHYERQILHNQDVQNGTAPNPLREP